MSAKKNNIFPLLSALNTVLIHNNQDSYLIGGFVRNYFLGNDVADIDIAIHGNSLDIVRQIADEMQGKYILLDEINKVARIVIPEHKSVAQIDITLFADTIEDDLSRRDFTINAMAIKLKEFLGNNIDLIDPFSGRDDLEKKKLRAVKSDVFIHDAVRLLRAVRLAAELRFTIVSNTEKLIKLYHERIADVSGERVREELVKILNLEGAGRGLLYLDKLKLLSAIIPEIETMKKVKQPREHYWDVHQHSLQTVNAVESLLYPEKCLFLGKKIRTSVFDSREIKKHFTEDISSNSNRATMLKLGALLHDIAKPQTKKKESTGRIRFIGHTQQGAAIAVKIMQRLRFSNKETNLVEKLVYYHLRPVQLSNIGLPSSRAIYRFFRDVGEDAIDILALAVADYLAARGPNIDKMDWENHNKLIEFIVLEHQKQGEIVKPLKLIDGHDIINIFNLTPGPLIGKLLALLYEYQALGKITNQEDAIIFIQKKLKKLRDNY